MRKKSPSKSCSRGIAGACAIALAAAFATTAPALAHETDPFTIAPTREMADIGDGLTAWTYDTLQAAIEDANAQIKALGDHPDPRKLAELQSPDFIASEVFHAFPIAYNVIEGLEHDLYQPKMRERFGGKIAAYKELMANDYYMIPLDPRAFFRIWDASTVHAFGCYLGTDKIGHFTDMGKHYYDAYRSVLRRGGTEQQAMRAMLDVGTKNPIYSEAGLLGNISAGDYSNGDLASNYDGFLFYLNLTRPEKLKGVVRPPLLQIRGKYWAFAPFVRRDSDFFSWFYSDHEDEALNPGLYEPLMRPAVRRDVFKHAEEILWRYRDANGQFRSPQWFVNKTHELFTYYGADYGHGGTLQQLVIIGPTVYEPLPAGAPLTQRNTLGLTALHMAAIEGDAAAVERLLGRGADPDARVEPKRTATPQSGDTALHLAATPQVTRILLAHGAKVDARNAEGVTPLMCCAGDDEQVQLLLQHGASGAARDETGRTALHWAANFGEPAAIGMLIARGCPVDGQDNRGRTALHLAARRGESAVVSVLLSRGATVDAREKLGMTPLMMAAAVRGEKGVATMRALLGGGAKAALSDPFGYTPLHVAARRGSAEAVELLLRRGVSPMERDAYGNTPLHLAARHGRRTAVAELLAAGADVAGPNLAGVTPLHEAAFAGDRSIVDQLLERGASLAARTRRGRSVPDFALTGGHADLAAHLRQGWQTYASPRRFTTTSEP